ncbi:MAG: hypothetical protein K2Y21_01355 [Phycisphaerales bacterium]|nr:hypothetical protein [Phycisphaerales bacterium]
MSSAASILALESPDALRVSGDAIGHLSGWTQSAADSLAQSLNTSIPPHIVAPTIIGAALFLSLLLWFRGAALARPSLTFLGICIGGLLGAAISMPIAGTVLGLPAPVVGASLGSIVGGFLGWASFRLVVGGIAGLVAGALAFTITLAQSSIATNTDRAAPVETRYALSNDEATIAQDAEELWHRTLRGEVISRDRTSSDAENASVSIPSNIDPIAVVRTAIAVRFEALNDGQKLFVSAAAAIAAAVATLLGLIAPRFTTSLAAAALGTSGVLVFGLAAGHMLHWNGLDRFASDPSNLAIAWGVLAVLSVHAQRPRKPAPPAPAPVAAQPAAC